MSGGRTVASRVQIGASSGMAGLLHLVTLSDDTKYITKSVGADVDHCQFYASELYSTFAKEIHLLKCRGVERQVLSLEYISDAHYSLGDQEAGMTVQQAGVVVRMMARLHRVSPAADQLPAFVPRLSDFLSRVHSTILAPNVREYNAAHHEDEESDQHSTKAVALMQRLADPEGVLWRRVLDEANKQRTVLHLDVRAGNLFFSNTDPQDVILFDWQNLCTGHPAFDLCHTLASSLTVEMRRLHEAELIKIYCCESGCDYDTFFQAYQVASLWPMIWASTGLDVAATLKKFNKTGEESEVVERFIRYTYHRFSSCALDHNQVEENEYI